MKIFTGQQPSSREHRSRLMLNKKNHSHLYLFLLLLLIPTLNGCGILSPKTKVSSVTLLKSVDATTPQLVEQINQFARINSMHAKMDLKFEDNSYAELGIAEKYKTANGDVVIQRPGNIFLKIQAPVAGFNFDIAQMTSDGTKFRVAVLEDGGDGKNKKFVQGSNNADYSALQEEINKMDFDGNDKALKQNVKAFSNLRPQHFTDAMLMRPVDTTNFSYLQSTISQEEFNTDVKKKSPLARVLRGYYLLDELRKNDDGWLVITRRFWFDRVGGIRLARQQIFDAKGEIESDIVYGATGNLTATGEYDGLPLRIEVTRPKEKYKMSLTYQSPESVTIGKTYNAEVFVLENRWNLPVVDLDKKVSSQQSAIGK